MSRQSSIAIPSECDDVKDVGGQPTGCKFELKDWLEYYKQCRELQAGAASRFAQFIAQASIFVAAICTAMISLRNYIDAGFAFLWIAVVASMPLFVFWRMIVAYFRQISAASLILHKLEQKFEIPEDLALLTSLRKPGTAFYTSPSGKLVAFGYLPLLIGVMLATALVLLLY
jgi:hypothetical protein